MFITFNHFKSATKQLYTSLRSNPSMKLSAFRELLINQTEHVDINRYQKTFARDALNKEQQNSEINNLELVEIINNNAILMMETNMFIDTSYIDEEYFNINFSDEEGNEYSYELEINKIKHKYYGDGTFGIWDEENFEFKLKVFAPKEFNQPSFNEIDKLKTTIAILRKGLTDIEINNASSQYSSLFIQNKAIGLLNETTNVAIKHNCYADRKDVLDIQYISEWEEGTVETTAQINIDSFKIFNIKTSDIGDDYEHLISEHIEIKIESHDKSFLFDIEDEKLTQSSVKDFVSFKENVLTKLNK